MHLGGSGFLSSLPPFNIYYILRKELVLNDVSTITVPIRLKKAQESCLYIDAWSAPGVQTGTRALIKHGEITALEDSIAAPEKLNQQYMAKK